MGERAGSKATARAWLRRRRNLVRGRRPAAKAEFDGGRFSAGLKSSFPLLKPGGCYRDSAAGAYDSKHKTSAAKAVVILRHFRHD